MSGFPLPVHEDHLPVKRTVCPECGRRVFTRNGQMVPHPWRSGTRTSDAVSFAHAMQAPCALGWPPGWRREVERARVDGWDFERDPSRP